MEFPTSLLFEYLILRSTLITIMIGKSNYFVFDREFFSDFRFRIWPFLLTYNDRFDLFSSWLWLFENTVFVVLK